MQTKRMAALVIGAVIAAGFSIHAQDRDTLETEVTAEGDVVLLKWSKKHPWDAQLLASAPMLLGEYRTPNGTVIGTDCLRGSAPAAPGRGGAVRGVSPSVCGIQG